MTAELSSAPSPIVDASPGRPWAAASASVLAYGMIPVVAAFGLAGGASPVVLVALRGVFAVAAIAVFCALAGRFRRIPVGAFVGLVLLCGPLYGLQVLAFFSAVQQGGAQLATVVTHVYPILVIVLVSLRDRSPVPWPSSVLAVVVLSGLAMITMTGGSTAPVGAVGPAFLSATGYALYLVASERWVHQVGTVLSTVLVTAGATVAAGGIALFRGESFTVTTDAWQVALIQGLVLLPVGLCGALYAVRALGSVPMSLIGMLEPVVGVALAAALLHERLTLMQGIGAAVILCACAALPWATQARPRSA